MVENKQFSIGEEKELVRVFTTLCNFSPKSKLYSTLDPLKERRDRIVAHKKNPDIVKLFRQDNPSNEEMTEVELDEELCTLKAQIAAICADIENYDKDQNKRVQVPDLVECLRSLGHPANKKEVEEMIWEVDENLDGCVDWSEFRLMFRRNTSDSTGLEPYQLYNLVMFMMYDKDGSGKVTVDETMHMLYSRYGRDRLEKQMRSLFGDDLKTADGDGELSFEEYLKAVTIRIPRKQQTKSLFNSKPVASKAKQPNRRGGNRRK